MIFWKDFNLSTLCVIDEEEQHEKIIYVITITRSTDGS